MIVTGDEPRSSKPIQDIKENDVWDSRELIHASDWLLQDNQMQAQTGTNLVPQNLGAKTPFFQSQSDSWESLIRASDWSMQTRERARGLVRANQIA